MSVFIIFTSHQALICSLARSENHHVCWCGFLRAPIYGVAHWQTDETEVQGEVSSTTIPFDYLIYAVGAETQTFGIPGVKEHACFMKEIQDAEKVS